MRISPKKINFVIYHANCTDGFGAAWAAWKLLGSKAVYYAASHGDAPPNVSGKNVAILDFSYPREITQEMEREAKSLVVIDHHKSAMKELSDLSYAHFDMSRSGAALAWQFFHPEKAVPKLIAYIEDRDLWAWKLPQSREFSAGLDTQKMTFESFSQVCNESVFESICTKGSNILSYIESEVMKICKKASMRTWKGNRINIVNSSRLVSEVGNKLSQNCDFAVIWSFDHNDQKYRVSLRSSCDHVDVSAVASKFGGGGHKKAAGFSMKRCVFNEMHIDDIFRPDVEPYDIKETSL